MFVNAGAQRLLLRACPRLLPQDPPAPLQESQVPVAEPDQPGERRGDGRRVGEGGAAAGAGHHGHGREQGVSDGRTAADTSNQVAVGRTARWIHRLCDEGRA